jgi:hypothetical protein
LDFSEKSVTRLTAVQYDLGVIENLPLKDRTGSSGAPERWLFHSHSPRPSSRIAPFRYPIARLTPAA